jgi:Asp/Glu/hydantoin racemase
VLIDTHGADVLILGCAGMARFRQGIATELNVPVIDPCQAEQYKRLLLFVSPCRLSKIWLGFF